MIVLHSLHKQYGQKTVLRDIQLRLVPGRVYGLVGENGAGKSTLFRCIAGLESFAGRIESAWQPLKNHLGFLPTDPYVFPRITGREYLQLLCRARGSVLADADVKNIFELPLDQYASTYSTGMRKKLALTGILLQPNAVYILDEPSNGVDIHSNMVIAAIIRELRSIGKIVLLSSHIFATLSETCDEISVLENGTISRHVARGDFGRLEIEMQAFTVGDRIRRLALR